MLLAKASSAAFGMLSIMLAGILLSPVEQGYFATFASFAATYMLVDLGIGNTIVQFASHETVFLQPALPEERRRRAQSRLSSIGRIGLVWFGISAIFFCVIIGSAGLIYFAGEPGAKGLSAPWIFLCAILGIDIALMPFWSLLEGMNYIVEIYRYRAARMWLLALGTAVTMVLGGGLWSLGVGYALTLPLSAYLILVRNLSIFRAVMKKPTDGQVNWRHEMLPYQGKLAMTVACGYIGNWTPTLFALKMFSPAVAGQIGMVWAAMGGVGMLTTAMIAVKVPLFGQYVASHRFAELDCAALRVGKAAMTIAFIAAAAVVGFVSLINWLQIPLASRFLPVTDMLLCMAACTVMQVIQPMWWYLRAFKREPFVSVSLLIAVFGLAGMIGGGYWAGPTGFVAGYLSVVMLIAVPLAVAIFFRRREEWREALLAAGAPSDHGR